jgi:hypothetical protein
MKKGSVLAMALATGLAMASNGAETKKAPQVPEQTIAVELKVPDPAWKVSIEAVYEVERVVWVVARLKREDVMAPQVIATVKAEMKVRTGDPALPVKVFVYGKTWGWENEEDYTFIDDLSALEKEMKEKGRRIWRRAADSD